MPCLLRVGVDETAGSLALVDLRPQVGAPPVPGDVVAAALGEEAADSGAWRAWHAGEGWQIGWLQDDGLSGAEPSGAFGVLRGQTYSDLISMAEHSITSEPIVTWRSLTPMCLPRRDRYYPGPDIVLMIRGLAMTWNRWSPKELVIDEREVASAARLVAVRSLAGSTALAPEEGALVDAAGVPAACHLRMRLTLPAAKLGDLAVSVLALLDYANFCGVGVGREQGLGACEVIAGPRRDNEGCG